jgi:hypothetical protein
MRYIYPVFLLLLVALTANSQNEEVDSCSITPTYTASLEGISKKGMLSTEDLSKVVKVIADEKEIRILRFTYSIDCDGCDMYVQDVYSDKLPEEETRMIKAMKPMQVLSFECIVGQNKKGELITCKPFLFYIKP